MGVMWFCCWGCGPGFGVWVEDVHEEVAVFEADHGGGCVELVVLVWVGIAVETRRGLGSSIGRVLSWSFGFIGYECRCSVLGLECKVNLEE